MENNPDLGKAFEEFEGDTCLKKKMVIVLSDEPREDIIF